MSTVDYIMTLATTAGREDPKHLGLKKHEVQVTRMTITCDFFECIIGNAQEDWDNMRVQGQL